MKIEIDKYQHFSFDLWLTLIRSNPTFKEKRDRLLKDFFSINEPLSRVREVVRYYDVLCNQISENTGAHIDRKMIYLLILNRLGIKSNKYIHESVETFCGLSEELFLDNRPVLIDTKISDLMKEITQQSKSISILSNTGFIHGCVLRNILEFYELTPFLSFQLYSDETGYSKPNKKLFEILYNKAVELKEINREDILHIGDNRIADFMGAKEVGFQALLVENS